MFHWFCGLYVHLFDKVQEKEAKYHPLTRSACRRSLVKRYHFGPTPAIENSNLQSSSLELYG